MRGRIQRILLSQSLLSALLGVALFSSAYAIEPQPEPKATPAPEPMRIYIREYRVQGAHQLQPLEVEEAVYPFLGPGRTADDVEQARASLEKAYKDKGFQTVSVEIPEQKGRRGIIILQVNEVTVGRLRVHGSRYFSLEDIKKKAPSLAEGKVPNFNEVQEDILALNRLPDRRVTPVLRAGIVPGTVDIDLQVKDTNPLHGSFEVNNRYSADTTHSRLNASLSYNNLWQLGHSIGGSFQVAPERPDDAKVFSAFYLARFPQLDWFTLTLQGNKQDSDVSTLGGNNSSGKGETVGLRAGVTLPNATGFYESASFGFDYKHADSHTITFSNLDLPPTPVTYYPLSASYTASWIGKGYETDFNADLVACLRIDTRDGEFDNRRYNSSNNFVVLRGDLSHEHDLPFGFQAFGKVQGQLSDSPLVDTEQFGGGGLSTARGYLESTALGDNALFGTLELRSPSLLGNLTKWHDKDLVDEWRLYAFFDCGVLTLIDALPEQQSRFNFASIGFGSRLRLLEHLNASVDIGFPLTSPVAPTIDTRNFDPLNPSYLSNSTPNPLMTFRAWAEF